MEEVLYKLMEIAADPYRTVATWKERTDKKVIGCFPKWIPEEMIHAAGALPVVMWESNEPITLAHSHILPTNCALSRSVVDDALKGKLSFMDGMVFYGTCLQADGLPFLIERNAPPSYVQKICLPVFLTSPAARDYLIENFEKLKAGLEQFCKQKITMESLNQSISVYNRNRALLRRLYDLRRTKTGILKAGEVLAIVLASMLIPKEEHSELLENLLPELEKRQPSQDSKVKIILSGSLCQAPSRDILDLVEDAGMVVVDDDFYTGYRYFANDVEISQDPLGALADRYLKRMPPCPTKVDWEIDWSDFIIDVAKRSGAQGVISLLPKFCPPHLIYYPDIKRKLSLASIPEILLEMEHESVSLEAVKTRVQAFVEMLGGANA